MRSGRACRPRAHLPISWRRSQAESPERWRRIDRLGRDLPHRHDGEADQAEHEHANRIEAVADDHSRDRKRGRRIAGCHCFVAASVHGSPQERHCAADFWHDSRWIFVSFKIKADQFGLVGKSGVTAKPKIAADRTAAHSAAIARPSPGSMDSSRKSHMSPRLSCVELSRLFA